MSLSKPSFKLPSNNSMDIIFNSFIKYPNDYNALQTYINNVNTLTPKMKGVLLGYAIRSKLKKTINKIFEDKNVDYNVNKQTVIDSHPGIIVYNSLILSIRENNIDIVKKLVNNGADTMIIEDDIYKYTSLHIACLLNNEILVKIILTSQLTKIDVLSSNGETPLMIASHYGNINLVNMLLDAKANPNIISLDGRTALHNAVSHSKNNIVIEKLASLYTMYSQFDKHGDTPLHIAILKQNIDIVKILLKHGFPVNEPNSSGDIPIMQCCRNFEKNIFEFLLEKGANYEFQNANGDTLLHNIVYMNDPNLLKIFFTLITPYVENTKNKIETIKKNKLKEFIKTINPYTVKPSIKTATKMTAYVNRVNNNGLSPLAVAVNENYDNLIPVLMHHTPNPLIKDSNQRSALVTAIALNNFKVVKMLIANLLPTELVREMNILTNDGCLPIQYAIGNYLTISNELATNGYLSIEQKEIMTNSLEIIKFCMKCQTDIYKIQKSGLTIADYIKHYDIKPLYSYLKKSPLYAELPGVNKIRKMKRIEISSRNKTMKIKTPPLQLGETEAYDPIMLETVQTDTWITAHKDNIIFIVNDNKYCVKRSYFMPDVISPYSILVDCVKQNEELYSSGEKYVSLETFGIINSGIVPLSQLELIANPKSIKQVYNFTKSNHKISTSREMEMTLTNIRNKKLFNTHIDLHDNNIFGIVDRKYILHLTDYTFKWDARVNYYLRSGKSDADFAIDPTHLQHYKEYASTPEEGIKKIKDKIQIFDEIFSKHAEISPKPIIVYRGTKNAVTDAPFDGYNAGYISTSTRKSVAIEFSTATQNHCCIYMFTIMPGVPFISMVRNSLIPDEYELLLPRGLTTVITKQSNDNDGTRIYHAEVRLTTPDQFKLLEHKCHLHNMLTVDNPVSFTDNLNVVNMDMNTVNSKPDSKSSLKNTPNPLFRKTMRRSKSNSSK